ncbi:GNAT family N-acetyltransferase [Erwinia pyrifoliae]|nr:GNAT family N-acetyltransferase [Erwinia pyrifoliae]MCT2386080.1 GNAT family N-acetyltransferase [Erwinia pyrifoliae]
MYRYSCTLQESQKDALSKIYNSQHNVVMDPLRLNEQINNAINLSNADVSFPLVVYRYDEIAAFCLVHLFRQEKIRSIGTLTFSILISNGDVLALKNIFSAIIIEAKKRDCLQSNDPVIYGPVHNSILVNRGYRTFSGAPFTWQMPDNDPVLCDWLMGAGCLKEKDLLEIVYQYDPQDILLTHTDERLLNRLSGIDFDHVKKDEIAANQQEIAEVYNIAWQDNWGFSPTTSEEIAIATENVQNIMGMIARKDGRIIGFTMMHFTENKVGRAFFSGVLPEYRQRGLSVVLTSKLSSIAIQQDISNFSISWMLEDNKMIVRTMQKLTRHGESQLRRYRIFAIQKII